MDILKVKQNGVWTAIPAIIGPRGIGITSITKTGTSGLTDTYTITFSDNTTTTFTLNNGAVPNLTIGTVTEGATAAATITGTTDAPVLNLVLPNANVPTRVSELENDAGYLTSYTETDPTVPAWAKAVTKPSYTATEVGALPSDTHIPSTTAELTNDAGFITSAALPTKVSELTNDAGYLTTHQDISGKADTSALAAVATSGNYEDLSNRPEIPEVPVQDVQVNGTSVVTDGVANIPQASTGRWGATKAATSGYIKSGNTANQCVSPWLQHESVFYGLSKVAGVDLASETVTLGTYPDASKAAIQQMLGVSDLIATAEPTLVASKAYAIGDVFTANGKLYKATAAIAANDTIVLQNEGETISGANAVEVKLGEKFPHDVQVNGVSVVSNGVANVPTSGINQYGVAKIGYSSESGLEIASNGNLRISHASANNIKSAISSVQPITPDIQHASTFYGLAKAAGDVTQSASDNAVGTYTDDAKAAIKSMIGVNVDDVQVNGTSVVSSGVANIPKAGNSVLGVISLATNSGLYMDSNILRINAATDALIKSGDSIYFPIVPTKQHQSVFYGLARAAGDTTQSSSSNAVGTYTDNAKASIKQMLGIQDGSTGTVDVSGTTPTITAVENTRYVCGEVTSLNFTPAASGICIVRFTSGSTVTVLTIPSTVKFPEWFDSTSLETNTIYEICVTDGVYGAVMSWAL